VAEAGSRCRQQAGIVAGRHGAGRQTQGRREPKKKKNPGGGGEQYPGRQAAGAGRQAAGRSAGAEQQQDPPIAGRCYGRQQEHAA